VRLLGNVRPLTRFEGGAQPLIEPSCSLIIDDVTRTVPARARRQQHTRRKASSFPVGPSPSYRGLPPIDPRRPMRVMRPFGGSIGMAGGLRNSYLTLLCAGSSIVVRIRTSDAQSLLRHPHRTATSERHGMHRGPSHQHDGILEGTSLKDPGAVALTSGAGQRAGAVWTPSAGASRFQLQRAHRPGGRGVAGWSRL
jgi:hypothetical protein